MELYECTDTKNEEIYGEKRKLGPSRWTKCIQRNDLQEWLDILVDPMAQKFNTWIIVRLI